MKPCGQERKNINSKQPSLTPGPSPILVDALLFPSIPFLANCKCTHPAFAYARQCCLQYPGLWDTPSASYYRDSGGQPQMPIRMRMQGNSARTGVMYVAAHMQ